MIDSFHHYLRTVTSLTDEEVDRVSAKAEQRTLRRNELVLKAGDICRNKTFITKGMLQTFGTSPDGSEYILQFSTENNWVLDAESYDTKTPSKYNIAAIEECELLMWNKPDFDQLLADLPILKRFAEQLISRSSYNARNRLSSALSATPEERYNEFVSVSPGLLNRLPLRMIAAYLGISIKTLTRLRHAQLSKN